MGYLELKLRDDIESPYWTSELSRTCSMCKYYSRENLPDPRSFNSGEGLCLANIHIVGTPTVHKAIYSLTCPHFTAKES